MSAPDKITPRDVLAQLQTVRALVDALPDSVATQRLSLQNAMDTAVQYVRAGLPKPGTYVTAGGAAGIGGVAAVLGAAVGGFLGYKLRGSKNGAPAPAALPAGAREPSLEEEIATMEAVAAEATRRAREARARSKRSA